VESRSCCSVGRHGSSSPLRGTDSRGRLAVRNASRSRPTRPTTSTTTARPTTTTTICPTSRARRADPRTVSSSSSSAAGHGSGGRRVRRHWAKSRRWSEGCEGWCWPGASRRRGWR
jgi:hypothetical protein